MDESSVPALPPDRWIAAIVNGRVQVIEPIPAGAVVIRLDDLPGLITDRALINDWLAQQIQAALDTRAA